MAKAIINKHINNINELENSLFLSDTELSKGEIVICNDKDNPSIYIKNTDGDITKIASVEIAETKTLIDNYTVNDKKISENPVLDTNDLLINEDYGQIEQPFENVIPGDSITRAISKIEGTIKNTTLVLTAGITDLHSIITENELVTASAITDLEERSVDIEHNLATKSDIEHTHNTNNVFLQKDIVIAGLDNDLGSYSNGEIISSGTSIYEILNNILCKEKYPQNIIGNSANALSKLNALTLTLNYSGTVEVGTLITLTEGKTNGTSVTKTNASLTGMEWGYSNSDNDTQEYSESVITKECVTSIKDNKYTISANMIGFDADTVKYQKTIPTSQNGEGIASLEETVLGCANEGDNKITINATGASFSYSAKTIDKVYYCSNLGNTDSTKFYGPIISSGDTNKATSNKSVNINAKYKYFLGYLDTKDKTIDDISNDDIRGLGVKTGWININNDTIIADNSADNVLISNGKSIIIACPEKYELKTITDSNGASLKEGFVCYKKNIQTGEILTKYNIYILDVFNDAVFYYKNIKIG